MSKNTYSVYCHTNKFNGKKYIGITRRKPELRWKKGSDYKHNPYFYNSIIKYGWNGFEHEILFENLSEDEAKEKERELISKYNTNNRNFGYNLTGGGDGLFNPCEELRQKMRNRTLGENNYFYDRHYYGENNPFWGKKHNESSREKISKNHADVSGKFNPRAKSVVCIELNKQYDTIIDASRDLNINNSDIGKCCRGKLKTAGGYHWKYAS